MSDEPVDLKIIVPFEVEALNDKGQFKGYGSTFGSKPDHYRDLIAKGAFVDTLAEHHAKGTYPVMLWSHDPTGAQFHLRRCCLFLSGTWFRYMRIRLS
jgi:hypothetical protein